MKWTICTETTFQCLENNSNRVKTKNPSRLLTILRKISKLYSDKMFCWISHLLHNIFIDWKMLRPKQVKRPLFYLTSLWIQTSSVTGVKKRLILTPTSKFRYRFQWLLWRISWSLMGLNRHNTWHSHSLHTLWTSSNSFYIPLPLHRVSQSHLLMSLASLLLPSVFATSS